MILQWSISDAMHCQNSQSKGVNLNLCKFNYVEGWGNAGWDADFEKIFQWYFKYMVEPHYRVLI